MSATSRLFKDKCSPAALTQCPDLSPADLASANSGANMVNFLRGQKEHEGFCIASASTRWRHRERQAVWRRPMWAFADGVEPYAEFQIANETRQGVRTSPPTTACCTPTENSGAEDVGL